MNLTELLAKIAELKAKVDAAYGPDEMGDDMDPKGLKSFKDMDELEAAQEELTKFDKEAKRLERLRKGRPTRLGSLEQAEKDGTGMGQAQAGDVDPAQEQKGQKNADSEKAEKEEQQVSAAMADEYESAAAAMRKARSKAEREAIQQGIKSGAGEFAPGAGTSPFGDRYDIGTYLKDVSAHSDLLGLENHYGEAARPYEMGGLKAVVDRSVAGMEAPLDLNNPGIVMVPRYDRTLLEIIPRQRVTRGTEVRARLVGNTGVDGAAAPVAAGAAIPDTAYRFIRVADEIELISEASQISLTDLQGDPDIYNSVLELSMENVELKLEEEIVTGNGTDPNLKGLLGYSNWNVTPYHNSAATNIAGSTPLGANLSKWQALIHAYWSIFKTSKGARPTHIVMHSDLMAELMADTGRTGQGGANQSSNVPIWDRVRALFGSVAPFVVNNQIATDTDVVLMGDFRRCRMYDYGELHQELVTAYRADGNAGLVPVANARNLVVGVFAAFICFNGRAFGRVDLSPS